MPSVCAGVAEMPSGRNTVTGAPPVGTGEKLSGLMATLEKETPDFISSDPVSPFYNDAT